MSPGQIERGEQGDSVGAWGLMRGESLQGWTGGRSENTEVGSEMCLHGILNLG